MFILNQTPSNVPEYSVSELSGAIKKSLENGFAQVRVRAECGRVTIAKSGHIYFDLKDDKAVINGIIWAGVARTLKTKPEEGLEIIATGRITTFEGQSRYQIIIDKIEPAGIGAILLQLEERRKKLAAEGLFDSDRKKPIPFLPATIGVVTSPTGAVIRDILHRLGERFPSNVLVWPVLVQGDKAAQQITNAINGFNELEENGAIPRPDVLIVARGGGSIEDLWCFNEEIVVRAVAASLIPVISAVGHETDTTLIDYAADLRAPTPTGAAEKAVPVRAELNATLSTIEGRLKSSLLRRLNNSRIEFNSIARAFPRPDYLFADASQRIDNIELRLAPALRQRINIAQNSYISLSGRLLPALQQRFTISNNKFANIGANFGTRLLVNDLKLKNQKIESLGGRLKQAFINTSRHEKLQITQKLTRLEQIYSRTKGAINIKISKSEARFENSQSRLNILDYKNILKRGFSLVHDQDGNLIKSVDTAKTAKAMQITFVDGDIFVTNSDKKPMQGSLF